MINYRRNESYSTNFFAIAPWILAPYLLAPTREGEVYGRRFRAVSALGQYGDAQAYLTRGDKTVHGADITSAGSN